MPHQGRECVYTRKTPGSGGRGRGKTSGGGLFYGFQGKEAESQNKQAYDWPVKLGSVDSWGIEATSSYLVPDCGVIRAGELCSELVGLHLKSTIT